MSTIIQQNFNIFLFALIFIFPLQSKAIDLQIKEAEFTICFTPGGKCTNDIINTINQAKKQILVQAYQLTSEPIIWALVDAYRHGVDVEVILDKSQKRLKKGQQYSPADLLLNQGIKVYIDYKPAIAHNKVMIIDDNTVITGSFNFSRAAQIRNAENLLILKNVNLARIYTENWRKRQAVSMIFRA